MRLLLTIMIAFVSTLVSTAASATHQWDVSLVDAERPGRIVTATVVAPADANGPCPVVVIGHATLTPCDHYRYLADALAEAGWLVGLPTTEGGMPGDQQALALDMRLLARALRDGDAALPPEIPDAASGPWALVGHSLGGGAAVLAAAGDVDAGAIAVLAPQERDRPSMVRHAVEVVAPTLVISGDGDCVTPPDEHHAPLFSALAAPVKAYCVLLGGGHCGFAGTPEVCAGAEESCPPDLTAAEHQAHVLALVLPWLNWQLRGQASAGAEFLLASEASDVTTTISAPTTAVAAPTPVRLVRLGAQGATPRWKLTMPRPDHVEATVFDLRGRRVRALIRKGLGSGDRLITWDGREDSGRLAPTGLYLLRVKVSGTILRDRTLIVR